MREFVSVHLSDTHPGIGTMVLTRDPTNALTRQAYRELSSAAAEVAGHPDIASVIIFGGHEIFCAGDDMAELQTLDRGEAEAADRVRREAIDAVAALPKPTVAAITGYALGAGLSLALAADWRVCGDNVKLGATEILASLVPGGGGCARLARVVGLTRAKELVFSGRFVYDAAASWAGRFVDAPAAAVAAAKELIDGPFLDAGVQTRRYGEVFAARTGQLGCPA